MLGECGFRISRVNIIRDNRPDKVLFKLTMTR